MPKFAANLTMLFPDRPFLERFEAAAQAGFKAVEFSFPRRRAGTSWITRPWSKPWS